MYRDSVYISPFLSANTIWIIDLKANFLLCLKAAFTMFACVFGDGKCWYDWKKTVNHHHKIRLSLRTWPHFDWILVWYSKSVFQSFNLGQSTSISGFSFSVSLLNIPCSFWQTSCYAIHTITSVVNWRIGVLWK